jgi:hypothetical protein
MPKSKKLLTCLAAALTVGAISAPGASGATEFGNNCAGTTPGPGHYTMVPISQAPGAALPLTAPVSGVVTKWKVNSAFVLPPGYVYAQRVRVFRSTGPKQFQTVGESSLEIMTNGINTHETRIPIQAGDRLGSYAALTGFSMWCPTGNEADVVGLKEGDIGPGGSAEYAEAKELQLAMSAVIEPDVDGDGFGDETQDKCTQSAALQVACPATSLDAFSLPPGKGSVRILVVTDFESSVTVSASAKVPKKDKKGKGTTATTLTPVTQVVTTGKFVSYTINFNKALKDALKGLSPKKSITLTISAAGKGITGAPTADALTVKVKGQAKPKG